MATATASLTAANVPHEVVPARIDLLARTALEKTLSGDRTLGWRPPA